MLCLLESTFCNELLQYKIYRRCSQCPTVGPTAPRHTLACRKRCALYVTHVHDSGAVPCWIVALGSCWGSCVGGAHNRWPDRPHHRVSGAHVMCMWRGNQHLCRKTSSVVFTRVYVTHCTQAHSYNDMREWTQVCPLFCTISSPLQPDHVPVFAAAAEQGDTLSQD